MPLAYTYFDDLSNIFSPETKHLGTLGVAAAVGHLLVKAMTQPTITHCFLRSDESMKAGAYLQDVLLDPKLAFSEEPNETPLNVAFKTTLPKFEWYEAKGNEHLLLRFGVAMEGSKQAYSPNAILEGSQSFAL